MSRSFSQRHSIAPPKQIGAEEAPSWLRQALYSQALSRFVSGEAVSISRGRIAQIEQMARRLLLAKALVEHISLSNQMHPPGMYEVNPLFAFRQLVHELPWFRFYDIVELIGQSLSEVDKARHSQNAIEYRTLVNACFFSANVPWVMNKRFELCRVQPEHLNSLENEVASVAIDAVSANLAKARRFLDQRPPDYANSIKESIMALEGHCKSFDPSAKTLGDAIKVRKKKGSVPTLLLQSLEKLYAFANSEAGVRHGSPAVESLQHDDAELVYVTALALIRYLREGN